MYHQHEQPRQRTKSSTDISVVDAVSNGQRAAPSTSVGNNNSSNGSDNSNRGNHTGNGVHKSTAAAHSNNHATQSSQTEQLHDTIALSFGVHTGVAILAVWLALFLGAVVLRSYAADRAWQVLGVFFYAASIIFGSGPVLVPLMYSYIVVPGWADSSAFLLGLAIINALPGTVTVIVKHVCCMCMTGGCACCAVLEVVQ
jgi:Chromate transporter